MTTTRIRRHVQAQKEGTLREAVSRQFTRNDLLGIFGAAIRARLQEGGYRPGKHATRGQPHPAGTKLVRRFIRRSGTEATYWRKAYRALTGHHYGEVVP
jgi:hypothetical protein